jgi:hypothetical protein
MNIIARSILVLGGLFYFVQASGLKINYGDSRYRLVAFMIGICALYFAFDRDYYLPFLGKSVIPIIKDNRSSPNLKEIKISNLPPNTRILYWAAKSASSIGDATGELDWRVYNDYSNSGVVQSDIIGNTIVKIECPVEYNVPLFLGIGKKRLKRHLHYRYEIPGQTGLFSRVYTKYIEC